MERWSRRMDTIRLRQRSGSSAMGVKRTLARSWVMSAPDPNLTLAYVERGRVASNTQRSVRCEPELATTQRRGGGGVVVYSAALSTGAGRGSTRGHSGDVRGPAG